MGTFTVLFGTRCHGDHSVYVQDPAQCVKRCGNRTRRNESQLGRPGYKKIIIVIRATLSHINYFIYTQHTIHLRLSSSEIVIVTIPGLIRTLGTLSWEGFSRITVNVSLSSAVRSLVMVTLKHCRLLLILNSFRGLFADVISTKSLEPEE